MRERNNKLQLLGRPAVVENEKFWLLNFDFHIAPAVK